MKNLQKNVEFCQNSMQDRDLSDQKVRIKDSVSELADLQSNFLKTSHNIMQNDGATTSPQQISDKSKKSVAFRPSHYFARPELTKRTQRSSQVLHSSLHFSKASKPDPSPSREMRVYWIYATERDLDRERTDLLAIFKELKENNKNSSQSSSQSRGKPKADQNARRVSQNDHKSESTLYQSY